MVYFFSLLVVGFLVVFVWVFLKTIGYYMFIGVTSVESGGEERVL